MSDQSTPKKRTYFGVTTPQQRTLLFETYEQTGDINLACRTAHVGRSTFYYWRPRFQEGGYEALRETRSHARHTHPNQVPATVVEEVMATKQAHPAWGRVRIAHEVAKAHDWTPVVSPSSVRRILLAAGLLEAPAPAGKKKGTPAVRHAEQPGETGNADLCFVPVTHAPAEAVPAVSGSSGRLVVKPAQTETPARTWPGQVFAREEPTYREAMDAFVAARQTQTEAPPPAVPDAAADARAQQKALRREEETLRIERRQERERRQARDTVWQEQRQAWRDEKARGQALSRPERRADRTTHQARQAVWAAARQQRHEELERRQAVDEVWRGQRLDLRQRLSQLPVVVAWIAVLVVVDNCTRQSWGLPLFVLGPHVTAEVVVAALRTYLPVGLRYLITDNGVHFTGHDLQQLAQDREFVRVPLARHRPCSNGIAERFVRTLKEWLTAQTWQTPEELGLLLETFQAEYNDRPHQGAELAGLSPNEYARRLRLKAA